MLSTMMPFYWLLYLLPRHPKLLHLELSKLLRNMMEIISKIDQAALDHKILVVVQALLLNQGPRSTSEMPWVALIGQSVSIAFAQSGFVGSV